ncbi:hypothetical protein ABK046_48110, partial [Streptomyces caeruleatus]
GGKEERKCFEIMNKKLVSDERAGFVFSKIASSTTSQILTMGDYSINNYCLALERPAEGSRKSLSWSDLSNCITTTLENNEKMAILIG